MLVNVQSKKQSVNFFSWAPWTRYTACYVIYITFHQKQRRSNNSWMNSAAKSMRRYYEATGNFCNSWYIEKAESVWRLRLCLYSAWMVSILFLRLINCLSYVKYEEGFDKTSFDMPMFLFYEIVQCVVRSLKALFFYLFITQNNVDTLSVAGTVGSPNVFIKA